MSSVELARRLGTRQPTAWLMKQKLMAAMAAREAEKPKLTGRVEVDDAYLGGQRPGGKRGRGAARDCLGTLLHLDEERVVVGLGDQADDHLLGRGAAAQRGEDDGAGQEKAAFGPAVRVHIRCSRSCPRRSSFTAVKVWRSARTMARRVAVVNAGRPAVAGSGGLAVQGGEAAAVVAVGAAPRRAGLVLPAGGQWWHLVSRFVHAAGGFVRLALPIRNRAHGGRRSVRSCRHRPAVPPGAGGPRRWPARGRCARLASAAGRDRRCRRGGGAARANRPRRAARRGPAGCGSGSGS